MPDLWMDVDTALSEVPVNIMPLLDDTDFKTIENAIAYNAAGMALYWHFVTTGGAYSVTAVTPTTGGNYDWTDQGDAGIYTIEIPASGGASINNDTEGVGWFTGKATGVLPWRGPTIGFRRAALNDLFIDGSTASTNLEDFFDGTGYVGGTAKLTVDVSKISGDATAADNSEAFFDGTGYAGTNNVIPTVTTVTNLHASAATAAELAKVPKSDSTVTWNATALASIQSECNDALVANNLDHLCLTATAGADMTTEVADNTILSRIIGSGDTSTFDPSTDALQDIRDKLTDIETDTQDLQTQIGTDGAGLTNMPWNAAWDAEVQSECADALTAYDPPTKAEMDTGLDALPTAAENADAVWDEALSGHSTAGTAGKALTDAGAAGTPPTAEAVADAVWDEVTSGHTGAGTAGKALTDANNGTPLDAAGVRSAVGLASANLDTQLADLPTNAELASALAAADDAVLAAIAALNNLSAAEVNAEVVDAISTDGYAAPTGVPNSTASLAVKVGLLYKVLINGFTSTASAKTFMNDAGSAEWEKPITDDGTTYEETKGEAV